jgi:hypothetical protein
VQLLISVGTMTPPPPPNTLMWPPLRSRRRSIMYLKNST